MGVAHALHPQATRNHLSVIAPKDGWVSPVSFRADLGHQLVIIFACVTCAIMGLPVTCCVQTTVRSAWMENVTVDSKAGEDSTARKKDALAIRKIARDMASV